MADIRTDGPDVGKAVKDSLIAGAVALGLLGPTVGLVTIQNMSNQLILDTRWSLVTIFVALVVVARFLLATVIWPRMAARKMRPAKVRTARWEAARLLFNRVILPLLLGFVLVYPLAMYFAYGPAGAIKWVNNFGVQILIYVMLGWGLNIVVGLAGLLDLGYVAFYAVGAYSYALLSVHFGLSFWILLPIAGIL